MARTIDRRRFIAELSATTFGLGMSLGCIPRTRADVRRVDRVVSAVSSKDGAGVKLRRALGHGGLPMLDPFLLLDEIHSDNPADFVRGFPTHPHRGFETVSYLISGRFEHQDSVGNSGIIGAGDCQWMTAGRGILHSEMPRAQPGEDLWGLQLWVNLPAKQKMTAPRYQDMPAASIPEFQVADAGVRLVTGTHAGKTGPVDRIAVKPTMMDVRLPPGATFRHSLPAGDSAFAWMLTGEALHGADATPARAGELVVYARGRDVAVKSPEGGRFLLVSAAPIGEPVARRGPFVMNTQAELQQAFADYRAGRLTDS